MAEQAVHFDVIVVGAGLMGSAAARHLAEAGAAVALIGPAEPDLKAPHTGVFASHYDQARITRKLDSNGDWSQLAEAAIARYGEIEQKGQRRFFHPVGAMMAGPETGAGKDFIQKCQRVAQQRAIPHEALRADRLQARFPYFSFPYGVLALYEQSGAGWLNPRDHVLAEIAAATAQGASLYRSEVVEIVAEANHERVICADGTEVTGARVIVACGAFSKAAGLLAEPVEMKVCARTIAFVEIAEREADRLRDMPSLVYLSPDLSCDAYILPPVRYADGKTYLKIGGDPVDVELETVADMKAWFRGYGNPEVGQRLADQLLTLMPDLSYRSIGYGSCATSFTPTGTPLIYPQTERRIALTGGNGASAKCADELGRLAALVASGKSLSSEGYESTFKP